MSLVKKLAVAAALAVAIILVYDELRADQRKAPPNRKRPIIIDRPYQVTQYRAMADLHDHAQT